MDFTNDSRKLKKPMSKLFSRFIRSSLPIFLGLANVSMTGDSPYRLLTDLDLQRTVGQESPALSSGLHELSQWESFNEWQCFDTSIVKISCVGHFLDPRNPSEETLFPSIQVELDRENLVFDQDEGLSEDCASSLKKWEILLAGQKSICIYAAYLQDIDDHNSYWILDQFKTASGYWPMPLPEEPIAKEDEEESDSASADELIGASDGEN